MNKYDPIKTEAKWKKIWQETGLYKTPENPSSKFYNLVMFPYPSGNLHIGHWYNFAPADTLGRLAKMQGKDVLEPFGFDAFGLPAENAAIQRGLMADVWTNQNISHMQEQVDSIGAMYDWNKSVNTSSPDYYRWTQWIFLKLFHDGKAHQKEGLVNWCPNDKTVLANEQVVNGCCERCDTKVERKNLKQWYLKITDYADRLLNDLDELDWPERIKEQQRNWIGKSEGAMIGFAINGTAEKLDVFTTRPDTLFGVTFMVIAPEHPLAMQITTDENSDEVKKYIELAGTKTDIARMEEKDKSGVFTGSYAVNPATNEHIPIWISDYVLASYGTGAIMAVPAHDGRDYEFAKKYGLEIKQVIDGGSIEDSAHEAKGKLINSGKFDGKNSEEAKSLIIKWLESENIGKGQKQYRLRDWLISRQRYWGTPIPIIHCEACGVVPVPEKDLPVILPLKQKFGQDGRSPLSDHPDFTHVECPECGTDARRETDTMDTFVDSSWYFLRYPNPDYSDGPFDPVAVEKWLPVDRYIGGAEHAVLHLLYSRFFTKFLYDQGHIGFEEPFTKLVNQGMILGTDGNKMSKSKGNVIDPDDYVGKYGSDAVRVYLMFMGPYSEGGPWDPKRFEGSYRFINRAWELTTGGYEQKSDDTIKASELEAKLHKTIKKVGDDAHSIRFNTAISALMELVNFMVPLKNEGSIDKDQWHTAIATLILLLAPFTPFMAEEMWEVLGNTQSVHSQAWPKYDPSLVKDDVVTIIVQINGKLKDQFIINAEDAHYKDELERTAKEKLGDKLDHSSIIKTVIVPAKLVNFVTA